jgi:hypothetical protein
LGAALRCRAQFVYKPTDAAGYLLARGGHLGDQAVRGVGVLEAQCGGEGNIARVTEAIEAAARERAPELVGFSPWLFADPVEIERRLRAAGFGEPRCWLEERPTYPEDVNGFVRTSILPAHLALLPEERREQFASAVIARVSLPLDYVRLNVSAIGGTAAHLRASRTE